MVTSTAKEGHVSVPGGRVWYRIVGSGEAVPLLTLHGGPGAGHDYLEPLEALAEERPVVFYDQLGCGKSDIPDDQSLWRIERFVEEVDAVRRELDLSRVHLLGHSWGGWLAIEYLMTKPAGIVSLTLASTSASAREFVDGVSQLLGELPAETRETLERHEASGDVEHPDYQAAVMQFYQRHLCRMDPWPDPALRSFANVESTPVYGVMWGASEIAMVGNLKDWDRQSRLGEIQAPTLITLGRYDEIVPACAETLQRGIAGSELRVFEESAHLAHLEEADAYVQTLGDFMRRAEGLLG